MKKLFIVTICFFALVTLNGQAVEQRLPGAEEISNRRTPFNLEELKVRWKKAALENCPGVPCITATVPGPPTAVVATAGNASASVAFVAPTNNGGSAITGYTVTSSPGGITATGTTSPINVTGLTNGTAYTFTIVATNAIGNSSPSTASSAVTPLVPFTCGTSTVADIDGNTYNTVLIGTQCWTKSNLKVSKYNDGTAIPLDASGGSTGSGAGETWSTRTAGAYCILDNEPSTGTNASNYGFLYNWLAATDPKKICPAGWHVPSAAEYITLTTFASPNPGYKLKSPSSLWTGSSTNRTDNFGFSMLPSYERAPGGAYLIGVGNQYAMFWTTTTVSTTDAKQLATYHSSNASDFYDANKKIGNAIRCLKD